MGGPYVIAVIGKCTKPLRISRRSKGAEREFER